MDSAVLLRRCWISSQRIHNTDLPTERGNSMLFWALLHINIVHLYAFWESGKSRDEKKFHFMNLSTKIRKLGPEKLSIAIAIRHGYNESNRNNFIYIKSGLLKWILNSIENFIKQDYLQKISNIRNNYISHNIDFGDDFEFLMIDLFKIIDHTINVLRALNRIEVGPFCRHSSVSVRQRWEFADLLWSVVEMDRSDFFREKGWQYKTKRYRYYRKS